MPLTMTAERETEIRRGFLIGSAEQSRITLLRELDAERAAHQETQTIARELLEALSTAISWDARNVAECEWIEQILAKAKGVLKTISPSNVSEQH